MHIIYEKFIIILYIFHNNNFLFPKSTSRPHCDHKRHRAGKQNHRVFASLTDFKQHTIQRIAQRLCTHGDRKSERDHLPDQVPGRLRLHERHHLHRKNRREYHNNKTAYGKYKIINHSGWKQDQHGSYGEYT